MVKTSENDYQTLQHTCIGTFNNPLSPFRNLSSHIVLYPPFRHQLPHSILGGMPFASHASLLRQPNVGYRLRPITGCACLILYKTTVEREKKQATEEKKHVSNRNRYKLMLVHFISIVTLVIKSMFIIKCNATFGSLVLSST